MRSVLQYVLQNVAVCCTVCSVLQCIAVFGNVMQSMSREHVLCCSVLQCVLQCGVVCCSVL